MVFPTENTGYEKTILSDLQGAWILLRESVVDTEGFDGWNRVLFHIGRGNQLGIRPKSRWNAHSFVDHSKSMFAGRGAQRGHR